MGMLPGIAEFVIHGITLEGEVFQPPEWAEQFCDMLGKTSADGRVLYTSYVRPAMLDGVAAVVVLDSLQVADGKAFEMIKQYVSEHRLQVRAGRGSRDTEVTGKFPVLESEPHPPRNNGW
jgi:hypothetical protein